MSTVPLDLELCPVKKETEREEEPMEVDDPETPMEVDDHPEKTTDLDDNDRYLIHLLQTNFESDTEQ